MSDFTTIADIPVDASFETLGDTGEAQPQSGDAFPVRVIRHADPEFSGALAEARARRPSVVLEVRVNEWARPERGDHIVALGARRKITDVEHLDPLRRVWRLDTQSA